MFEKVDYLQFPYPFVPEGNVVNEWQFQLPSFSPYHELYPKFRKIYRLNQFHDIELFRHPLKTSESQTFTNVFNLGY